MVNFKFFKPLVLLAFLIPIFPVSVDDGRLQWKPSKRDVNIAYELPQVFLSGCTLWSQLNSTTEDIPYQVVGENMEVLSNGVLSC